MIDKNNLIDLLNLLDFKYELEEKENKIFLYLFFNENDTIDIRFLFLLDNLQIDFIDFKHKVIKLSEVIK
jgi:hypothetical protein